LHSFLEVLRLSPAMASCTDLVQKKPIFWAKPAHFDFFTINFTVWSHILSTSVDAFRYVAEDPGMVSEV
jgi:hypothetical protein